MIYKPSYCVKFCVCIIHFLCCSAIVEIVTIVFKRFIKVYSAASQLLTSPYETLFLQAVFWLCLSFLFAHAKTYRVDIIKLEEQGIRYFVNFFVYGNIELRIALSYLITKTLWFKEGGWISPLRITHFWDGSNNLKREGIIFVTVYCNSHFWSS